MASITVGSERLYDINYFENDNVLPDLFRIDSIPKHTTMKYSFMHIKTRDHERQEFPSQLNKKHFKKHNIKSIILDIDGSAL